MTASEHPQDTDHLLTDLFPGPAEDPFAVFEMAAWKPYEKWDSEPMTRENFAQQLFELGTAGLHEMRAVMLERFASQVSGRIGGGRLSVSIGNETKYEFNEASNSAALALDYRTSLVGDSPNRQLNAFVGLLVRGVGEHMLNEPDSRVRSFMSAIEHDFSRFRMPEIGDYAEQQAKIALTDRAIAAQIEDEWPGFSKFALDGLYELQASASQKQFGLIEKQLDAGTDAEGKPLSRNDRKRLELEMASQYLQASATAPGHTFVNSGRFGWAMDIEQAALMYRNITNLDVDHEFATRGNDIYGKVVERILDLPDTPPEPPASGLPDLSALQQFQEDMSGGGDAAREAAPTKSTLDNAKSLGTDKEIKFDAEKFNKLKDEEPESCDERTPWAEGNPYLSYFTLKTKPGPVARARYDAIRRNYGPQIRKLRNIIADQYTLKMQTERGLTSGRPDSARLSQVRFGRTEVFKRETPEITGVPINVVFLIDESGSMSATVDAKGYKPVGTFVTGGGAGTGMREMAGSLADTNLAAEEGGGRRADVARATGVILHEAVRGLTGIQAFSLGYTTGNRADYGLPPSKHGRYGDSMIRTLGTPKDPHGVALTLASSGNGDAEALHAAIKLLDEQKDDARKAIIYLADGGISDQKLESMLKNVQKEIPIFFVDMSNSVRGGQSQSSLKIKHSVTVNSMDEAVRGLGKFFTDIVLAGA